MKLFNKTAYFDVHFVTESILRGVDRGKFYKKTNEITLKLLHFA